MDHDAQNNGIIKSTEDRCSMGKNDIESSSLSQCSLNDDSSNDNDFSEPADQLHRCSESPLSAVEREQNACVKVMGSTGRLSLSLIIDNESPTPNSTLCPFSPQTPCSQFESCVLSGVGHCGGIAGAALCRWDMIVGRKVVYIWATSAERRVWLAKPDMLGFIAHFTVVSEVLRCPRNEAKFFVSPSDGIVLASFLFDASPKEKRNDFLSSDSLMTHSISVVLPHSEIRSFLKLKTICLEWLGRTAVELRVRLAKDVDVAYDWFRQAFTEFLQLVNSLHRVRVPLAISLADTAFYPDHSFSMGFVRRAIAAHLYQCQQTVVIGSSVSRVNLMIATLSMFVIPTCRDRCRYLVESNNVTFSPELCVQGLLKTSDWSQQLISLEDLIFYGRYPTALVDVTNCEVFIVCAPYEYSSRQRKFVSSEMRHIWSDSKQNMKNVLQPLICKESLVEECLELLQLLPLTHGVREAYIQTFMASLQRKALAVIQFVAVETNRGKCHRSSLLGKIRDIYMLKLDGDLMAVLCTAERLRPGLLNLVCGTGD